MVKGCNRAGVLGCSFFFIEKFNGGKKFTESVIKGVADSGTENVGYNVVGLEVST